MSKRPLIKANAFAKANDNTSQSNHKKVKRYPEMDYFMDEKDSDVVFVIDGQRLPAHRLVLRLKSEVFRAMFSGHFKESTDKEISIVDTTVEAFKSMLQYLYTENLVLKNGKDLELIGDVLALADKYQLIRLTDACEQHMLTIDVTVGNTTVMYGLATKYALNKLIQTLKPFIVTNLDQFLAKTGDELIELNAATDNWWLKIMANGFIRSRNYFKPKLPSANNAPGGFTLNGIKYCKTPDLDTYRNEFQFENFPID